MAQRGRKPLPSTISTPEVNEEQVRADLNVVDQLPAAIAEVEHNQQTVLAQFGDGGEYNRNYYLEKCRYNMARSAEAALEVGRCLIVMKECEGHGNWLPLLEEIGIDQSVARRMMQTATRLSNRALTHDLVEVAKSKTKLFELMVLDDDELAALNDGETVRGLQLDDVDRMSVSELRRALRQEKADKEAEVSKAKAAVSGELAAKDRMIADKSKRIAELVDEKNQRERMTEGERAESLELALTGHMLTAAGALIPVRNTIHAIRSEFEHVPNGLYVAMQAALHRVLSEAESIANDYGISLDFGLPTFSGAGPLADLDDPNAGETFGQEIEPV